MAPIPPAIQTSVHNLRTTANGDCAFHFLHPRFPTELRNLVYRHVTCDKQIFLTSHYTITAADDTCLGLCLTNHQINREYQAENARYATLHVYVNLSFNAPNWDRMFRGAPFDLHNALFRRLLGKTRNLELRTHDKCTEFSRSIQECLITANGLLRMLPSLRRFKLEYQVPLFAFEEVICANPSAHRLILEMPIESPEKLVIITNRDLTSTVSRSCNSTIFFAPEILLHDFCFSPISVLPARLRRTMHQFSDNRIEYHATVLNPPNERCSWYGLNLIPKLTMDFDTFYVKCIQEYLEDIEYAAHSNDDLQAFVQDKIEFEQWYDQLHFDLAERTKLMFGNMTSGSNAA